MLGRETGSSLLPQSRRMVTTIPCRFWVMALVLADGDFRPSFFEVLSQQRLSAAFHAAFTHAFTVYSDRTL